MKRNNKGYSFVELILTMAIFSIVMLAIILMMRTSLVSYKEGLFETTMQEDAQIVANQIADLLVDATYINTTPGENAVTYSFKGPVGAGANPIQTFTLTHEVAVDEDGNPTGEFTGNLWYNGNQLLSDKVKTFTISGLARRTADDETTIYDNTATVKVGIEYQGREYTASKDVYFRNNIENIASDTESFDPYEVKTGVISGGGGNPGEYADDVSVLRYQPLNISADYDIVYDFEWGNGADGVGFTKEEKTNTMIKNPLPGKTPKTYIISVSSSYEGPSGWTHNTRVTGVDYFVKGKNSKGEEVKVKINIDPVGYVADAGIFTTYRNSDGLNEKGFPQNIQVKGINIHNATKKLDFTYDIAIVKNGYELGKNTNVSLQVPTSKVADKANDVPVVGNIYGVGLMSDPASNGLVIAAKNGYNYGGGSFHQNLNKTVGPYHNEDKMDEILFDYSKFPGETYINYTMYVTVKGSGLPAVHVSQLDKSYKFRMEGNSLVVN